MIVEGHSEVVNVQEVLRNASSPDLPHQVWIHSVSTYLLSTCYVPPLCQALDTVETTIARVPVLRWGRETANEQRMPESDVCKMVL